ncbi:MAG: flavodoxin reductase, partial [Sinomicrobium sp.]|nr:flavodoxin reductase [Sinomicrobium sp.]
MNRFYPLTVKTIERITPRAVTVAFRIPETLNEKFLFTAGQYITIKKELNGAELRRSYSVCTSPKSGELKIGVKKTDSGVFSRYVNSALREGDVLEVHPPEGRFVFIPEKDKERRIMAFAAGSGITPVMSIMKTVLEEEPQSSFVLVYGNKSVTETMFYEELLQLTKTYPRRLSVHNVYSESREENALFGRIDRAVVNYVLKNRHKDQAFDAFYLCGPEVMIHTVTEVLQDNSIEKERIFFELFTSPEMQQEIPPDTEGKTHVTVVLDNMETSFVMDKKQRILDA